MCEELGKRGREVESNGTVDIKVREELGGKRGRGDGRTILDAKGPAEREHNDLFCAINIR